MDPAHDGPPDFLGVRRRAAVLRRVVVKAAPDDASIVGREPCEQSVPVFGGGSGFPGDRHISKIDGCSCAFCDDVLHGIRQKPSSGRL